MTTGPLDCVRCPDCEGCMEIDVYDEHGLYRGAAVCGTCEGEGVLDAG